MQLYRHLLEQFSKLTYYGLAIAQLHLRYDFCQWGYVRGNTSEWAGESSASFWCKPSPGGLQMGQCFVVERSAEVQLQLRAGLWLDGLSRRAGTAPTSHRLTSRVGKAGCILQKICSKTKCILEMCSKTSCFSTSAYNWCSLAGFETQVVSSAPSSVWLCIIDMLSKVIGTLGLGNLTETPAQETAFCVTVLGFMP